MKEFLTVFRRWRDFSGRSSRREYWMFTLVLMIIAFVLGILDGVMLGVMGYTLNEAETQLFTLGNAYSLVTLIPSISVSVRRLHDIDKSGWWLLLVFTGIGILLIIYWACLGSDEDENRYGSLVLPDQEPLNAE
jgi:uncharacterized membrane protein YhaH (DUF805 family)